MDLNSIFIKSNTFEDINHNILRYFIELTQGSGGIIYYYRIKENNIDMISFFGLTADESDAVKKRCASTTVDGDKIEIIDDTLLLKYCINAL